MRRFLKWGLGGGVAALILILLSGCTGLFGFDSGPSSTAPAPEQPAGAGQYVVVLEDWDVPEGALDAIRAEGGEIIRALPQIGVVFVRAGGGFAERIRSLSGVKEVGPDRLWELPPLEPAAVINPEQHGVQSNSLYIAYQWDIKRVGGIPETWDVETGDGVTVAVLDTGVDYLHIDIAPNYAYGHSYINPADLPPGYTLVEPGDEQDYLGHGTHVAGSIAAPIEQGAIIGVAPGAKIANYKVLAAIQDPEGEVGGMGFDSWIIPAIVDAADDGCQVINMSLGGYDDLSNPDDLAAFLAFARATQYAWEKGTLVVAAAGNDAVDLSQGPYRHAPAATPHALSISATGPFDELASYSNYGAHTVDFAGPGGDVLSPDEQYPGWYIDYMCLSSLYYDGTDYWYAWMAGTSMAAPKVTGVAALIYAHYPGITPHEVVEILEASAEDIGATGYDFDFGWGLVNAYRALVGE
jgi:hypothetical protein